MPGDTRRGVEIELKLTGSPSALTGAFRSLKGERPGSAKTVSTYYDTVDGHLWRRGFTLRLRPAGSDHELTLKRESGGELRRGEWTSLVAAPIANVGLLPREAPRNDIGTVLPEELHPCFTTDVERTKKRVEVDGAAIEVVLDRGRIAAGDTERALSELEFELLDGSVAALLKSARGVLEKYALRVETTSKAAQGRRLATDAPPPFFKAARLTLRATDRLGDAVSAIVRGTALQIASNLAAAVDGRDPEGVHQLRVGLRRLRSLLSLLADRRPEGVEPLVADAKWALGGLGEARDLDVFLTETLPPVMHGAPDAPGLSRLATRAEDRARTVGEDVQRLIRGKRFNLFLVDLLLLAEGEPALAGDGDTALGPVAGALLTKRHRKVLKAGRAFHRLSNPERHNVRIALKKLRYASDFFQALHARKRVRPWLAAMSELQDMLGRLNDATVAAQIADRIAADDPEAALGAAVIAGWYSHRLQAVEARMVAAWRAFAAMPPFWRD